MSKANQVVRNIFHFKPVTLMIALAVLNTNQAYAETVDQNETTLPEVSVESSSEISGDLPKPYAGGQVAKGARIGVLGNQNIMDVPFNFTSYTSQTIENQQAQSIADVLMNDPSVRSGQAFGIASQSFVIRGLPLKSDDLSFNGLFNILPRQLPPVENVERVEVFKGASAFLNGVSPAGSGIGGSVNIVPKRADDKPLTRATLDYTGDGQVGGHVDIGRRFGVDNQFGVRLNAVQRDGNTAIDDEKNKLTFGALGLDYQGENFKLSSDLGYMQQNITRPRLAVTMGGTAVPAAPRSDVNYSQPWTFTKVESTYGMFRGEYDFSKHLNAYAAIGGSHNNEFNDLTALTVLNNGSATGSRFTNVYNVESVSGEAGININFETADIKHTVNIGTTATRSTVKQAFSFYGAQTTNIYNPISQPEPTTGAFSLGSLSDPKTTSHVRIDSLALSDTLSIFEDKARLTLGARRQSIHITNYAFGTGIETDDSDKSITTPIYGIVIKPWQYLSLYANHIEGLSQGPVPPLGASNFGQGALPPLQSKQNEIGAKTDFGNYGATLALFEIKMPSTVTNAANVFTTDGEQRNRGVEFNAYGEPLSGWRVLGGAAFTDAELSKTQGGANDGNTSFGVPHNQYNLGTEYDLGVVPGLTITARWIRTGAQYVNQSNTLSIPSWDRLDIGARYAAKIDAHEVMFRANVENLFDKDYWASVSPTFGQVTMGAPRTVKLSATLDF